VELNAFYLYCFIYVLSFRKGYFNDKYDKYSYDILSLHRIITYDNDLKEKLSIYFLEQSDIRIKK